ncbi:hypothetical protein [Tepidibacillus fermentans]|uniref:hypothetical protein n=1 Tax=Tepidibacillus fermentans TaxID=1281767 RepID=UPI001044960B|nr:hypothetical protein [Tepidibacillus fermentans]
MVLDEPKANDEILVIDDQKFLFDPFTVQTFDEPLKLDYSEIQGFKLSTPSEILAYGLYINL